MSLPVQTGQRIAQDAHELWQDTISAPALLASISNRPETQAFLCGQSAVKLAAAQLLTKQLYDIGHSAVDVNPAEREKASQLGGLTLLLADIIDDQVDSPEMPIEEKFTYLDQGVTCLLDGNLPARKTYPTTQDHEITQASFDFAEYIHHEIECFGGREPFAEVLQSLVSDIKQQFISQDLSEHLALLMRIGIDCSGLARCAIEAVAGHANPEVILASEGIGAYAECMDNAYEIQVDLKEGVVNYATLFLARFGDTRFNRHMAQGRIIEGAYHSLRSGSEGLKPDQRVIYTSAKSLVDVKYRIMQRTANLLRLSQFARRSVSTG